MEDARKRRAVEDDAVEDARLSYRRCRCQQACVASRGRLQITLVLKTEIVHIEKQIAALENEVLPLCIPTLDLQIKVLTLQIVRWLIRETKGSFCKA